MVGTTEQKFQLGGLALLIIGFILAFVIGYFVQGFPVLCSLGGFILLIFGAILVALGKAAKKKWAGAEKRILDNNTFLASVFLFVGLCMIVVSIVGISLGDFAYVWEEPVLYSAIGICVVIGGLYLWWKGKK